MSTPRTPVDRALGVSIPNLRKLGRRYRTDHALALALWGTSTHEARILASMVNDPAAIAEAEHLLELDSSSARWIARDALRELRGDTVLRRLSE